MPKNHTKISSVKEQSEAYLFVQNDFVAELKKFGKANF